MVDANANAVNLKELQSLLQSLKAKAGQESFAKEVAEVGLGQSKLSSGSVLNSEGSDMNIDGKFSEVLNMLSQGKPVSENNRNQLIRLLVNAANQEGHPKISGNAFEEDKAQKEFFHSKKPFEKINHVGAQDSAYKAELEASQQASKSPLPKKNDGIRLNEIFDETRYEGTEKPNWSALAAALGVSNPKQLEQLSSGFVGEKLRQNQPVRKAEQVAFSKTQDHGLLRKAKGGLEKEKMMEVAQVLQKLGIAKPKEGMTEKELGQWLFQNGLESSLESNVPVRTIEQLVVPHKSFLFSDEFVDQRNVIHALNARTAIEDEKELSTQDLEVRSKLEPQVPVWDSSEFHSPPHVSISRGTLKPEMPSSTTSTSVRVDKLAQLVPQVQNLAIRGGGSIKVRIVPEHLGELVLTVRGSPSHLDVQLEVSNNEARQALLEALPEMKQLLNQKQAGVANIEVKMAQSHFYAATGTQISNADGTGFSFSSSTGGDGFAQGGFGDQHSRENRGDSRWDRYFAESESVNQQFHQGRQNRGRRAYAQYQDWAADA